MRPPRSNTAGAVIVAFFASILALSVFFALAANGAPADVCPEEGKVESVVDGDLDDIVLPAGTEVCIFGAATQINVTADGESTLFELLGLDRNVSHYTITEVSPSTTIPETTTTTEASTTTTESSTTTEPTPSSTTSTQPTTSTTMESTTTTETSVPATTTVPEDPSTTIQNPSPPTLPFTGPGDTKAWAGLGSLLLLSGLTTLVWSRRRDV